MRTFIPDLHDPRPIQHAPPIDQLAPPAHVHRISIDPILAPIPPPFRSQPAAELQPQNLGGRESGAKIARDERILAQPMGRNHTKRHEEARAAADEEKSMKIRQRDLHDRMKRTCEVIIWFKVCPDPVISRTAAN